MSTSDSHSRKGLIKPRIIIHGGSGNITKTTIPRDRYDEYIASLSRILELSEEALSKTGAKAIDVATFAVTQLEDDALYNSGKGAVFTRAGENELECSIMVSNGLRKRSFGCMMLKHVKNPIKLAREILIRGEEDNGGGVQDHCAYSGDFIESRAKEWGLEIVDQNYFWTKKRWDEHRRGLAEEKKMVDTGAVGISEWEKETYVPLGTCGVVVVDSFGTVCAATSTGGLTNKVPGRIGDTPTVGAGFWAEEWWAKSADGNMRMVYRQPRRPSPLEQISEGSLGSLIGGCLPSIGGASRVSVSQAEDKLSKVRYAVGLSGTGNGDTFLRLCAARTTAAHSRFTGSSLGAATSWMAGPGGELQRSAGDRWAKKHEGVGGMIGIEVVGDATTVAWDFNCGGMFRAWIDDDGKHKVRIFEHNSWESGPER